MKDSISPKLKDIVSKLQTVLSKIKEVVPTEFQKWLPLIPAAILVLVLVLILVSCVPEKNSGEELLRYTVSVDNLNVHKNYSADSSVMGFLPEGLEVEVLEQIPANGSQWGRIDKVKLPDGTKVKGGWIDLKYAGLPGSEEPVEPTVPPTEPPVAPTEVVLPDPDLGTTTMGTVTAGKLNIRKGAGSKYEAFDSYIEGDRIEIQEIVTVDGTDWGFTGKGWVGMGYVRLDGEKPNPADIPENLVSDGNYAVLGYGVVDLGELNVRLGPDTEFDKAREIPKGARYAYYQEEGEWVRMEDGWVSKEYFYVEGTKAVDAATGTVTADDLNIRTGPSTTYKSKGTLKKGEFVEILGQIGDWGYTSGGWINITNVELGPPIYAPGNAITTSGLNIRKEPDAESETVDTYQKGDIVVILEVSGEWGRTDKGWINLRYVEFD